MHPIDNAILEGTITPELLAEHAKRPLPPTNTSYWGDAMRSTDGDAVLAARKAAREMGSALSSHAALQRTR